MTTDPQTVTHEAVVRALHDAFRRRDAQAGMQTFAPTFGNHGVDLPRVALAAVWTDIWTRFPDARLDLLDLVSAGEWVVVRNAYSGTHQGVGQLPVDGGFLVGVPPTGRHFSVQHIHMYRLQDGLVVEHHACRDDIELMRQLGLPLALQGAEERNRAVVEQAFEAVRQRGLTAQLESFAPVSGRHGFPTARDDIRRVREDIEATFPDPSFEVHEMVAQGDRVTVHRTLRGTHLGTQRLPFVHGGVIAGLEPTGRSFAARHVHLFRLEDGLIVQHDAVQDNLEMARQLGVTAPAPSRGKSPSFTRSHASERKATMAVLIVGDVPGQTQEGYEGMIAALAGAMQEAPGFVMHTAYPVEGGWRVVEVWETARDASQFFATFVHPNLPPGIRPRRSVLELHGLVGAAHDNREPRRPTA